MAIKEYPSGVIPTYSGQSGKFLTNTGSALSWGSPSLNWTLINTGDTSIGTATTKTFSNLGGYDKYYVEVRTISSTSTIQPSFSMALNGGTGSATAFVRTVNLGTASQYEWISSSLGGTSTTIDLGYTATGSGGMNAVFYMDGSLGSGIKHYYLYSAGSDTATYGARARFIEGQYSLPLTSLTFTTQGNNFDGGSVFIYGA